MRAAASIGFCADNTRPMHAGPPPTPPDEPARGEDASGYELAPEPVAPALPGRVVLCEAREDAIEAAAADLFVQAAACVGQFGDFHLAVSGEAASLGVCLALLTDPKFRGLAWERTHLWVVEEAAAGPGDDESAFRELAGLFLDHAGVPAEQMHPVPTRSAEAAAHYEAELRECLGWRERGHDRLDFVVLPIDAAVPEGTAGALVTSGGVPARVSLTAGLLNASRAVAVVGVGPEHAGTLAPGRAPPPGVARLRPLAGELRWYLDHAAVGRP
jgi:6-phosphogluconolactonase